MKVDELLEGKVKDLWMKKYLHPDGTPKTVTREPVPKAAKRSEYPRNVESLAKKAGLDPSIVLKHYDEAARKFDRNLPNYWALVISATKKAIGLK